MSNPTHILIPIKDIEDRLKKLNSTKNKHVDGLELVGEMMDGREKFVLNEILSKNKKLSLDEEDIKTKALQYDNLHPDGILPKRKWIHWMEGYKQALKDLLLNK